MSPIPRLPVPAAGDADEVYADTLVRGLGKVSGRKNGTTTKETTR